MAQPRRPGPDNPAHDGRNETDLERLDRNFAELVGELRVAQTGVQILFAFLLVLPFSANFKQVSSFERHVYFVTLLLATLASALMIAPSPLHRLLFRRFAKEQMVAVANVTTLAGLSLLALSMTGVVLLISDFLWGSTTAIVSTVSTALVFGALWYGLPLWVRSHLESGRDRAGPRDREP